LIQNELAAAQKDLEDTQHTLRGKEVELLDKCTSESDLRQQLKSINKDKEELALQLSSTEEKAQKLEMDRDQLRLKHKQQLTVQSDLEVKLKTLTGDRDALNTKL
jgi:chromosome segregation ATPase